jgi:signal peptidase
MEEKTKKTLKNIIGWVLYIAILIALVFGIPKALSYALETEHPMAAITSGSMWPTLKKGDLILIKGVDSREEIGVGDVIVYKNPKGFTIHRVVKLNEDTVVTKGDANNTLDAAISYDEIIGKAFTVRDKPLRIPLLGAISIFVNKNKL